VHDNTDVFGSGGAAAAVIGGVAVVEIGMSVWEILTALKPALVVEAVRSGVGAPWSDNRAAALVLASAPTELSRSILMAVLGDEVPFEAIMSAVHGNGLLSAGAADSPRGGRGLADIAYAPPPAAAATSADPWSVGPRPLPPLSPCRLPPRPLPTSDAWSVEPRSLLLSYAELPNCHGAGREAQGEERHSSQVKSS
jgi:hypothetical protein